MRHRENTIGRASHAGASQNTRSAKRLQLLMMIAALWIIKDPSTDNDRGTHAEERNKASQYSDHCSLPWFFCFSTHDSTHYIRFGLHRRRAVSRSRFRALTRIKLSAHGPGGTATSEASKPRFGVPALANARYAGVGTREVAAPFDSALLCAPPNGCILPRGSNLRFNCVKLRGDKAEGGFYDPPATA